MYDWYLKVLLKNGRVIKCKTRSEHKSSADVSNELFAGPTNQYIQCIAKEGVQTVAFLRSEVAAYWLSTVPFNQVEANHG